MRLCLRISGRNGEEGRPIGEHYIFTVVDLDKADTYPMNFICKLPLRPNENARSESAFTKTFGAISTQLAKQLLKNALKKEEDPKVAKEIKRRLKLLEPKPFVEKKCIKCGAKFQTTPKQAIKRTYCPKCVKERFLEKRKMYSF